MRGENRLIIAAAGSGKTTFLVEKACEKNDARILIVTYTIENADEIRRALVKEKGYTPSHIDVQTWFSFLIQHCVKPYQHHFASELHEFDIFGMLQVNEQSAFDYKFKKGGKEIPVYFKETDTERHFFSRQRRIFSDKISKFAVGGGNSIRQETAYKAIRERFRSLVIGRLSRIYTHIFVDEVQDLAGYDLEFLKMLFESEVNVVLVGDPRQVTYLTHLEPVHKRYRSGKIADFIRDNCKKCFPVENIDETTLAYSHRNNREICIFSSRLYANFPPSQPCSCEGCRAKEPGLLEGVFAVSRSDRKEFLSRHKASVQLRDKVTVSCLDEFPALNFGVSKGRSFDSVLIYPTEYFKKWLKNPNITLPESSRAKFYVAVTRAKHSVGIVCDENFACDGLRTYGTSPVDK